MSQNLVAWLEILEQILGKFHALDRVAPDWLVDAETGSRLRVDKLYPELGIAVRFKGAPQSGGLGNVAFMQESARDEIYARLCREAGMALVTIDIKSAHPGRPLIEMRTALSAAGSRIAQERVAQDAKLTLLPRVALAKTTCQEISETVSSPEDLQPFARAWGDRESVQARAVVPQKIEPQSKPELEPEPEPAKKKSRTLPVQAQERIEFVDIVRGFALFGVLAFNLTGFSGQSLNPPDWPGSIDRAVVVLLRFLIQAKFYTMFSFLFGWGMSVQLARAKARGAKFLPTYLRRLFILLIFGVLHGILLWDGDILTAYALLGFLLFLFRNRSTKFILASAGIALLYAVLLNTPLDAVDAFREWWGELTSFLRSNTYSESLYATGSYLEIIRVRAQSYTGRFSGLLYYGDVFAMFLLGLYVGRRRLFQELDRHLVLIRKVRWIGLVFGLILNSLFVSTIIWPDWVPPEYRRLVAVGSRLLGAPALMLFYVTTIILLARKENWHNRLAPLANIGRSALSNYLLQSLICNLIFYSYGLGLYGQIGPAFGFILTLIIYYSQIQISNWWFDRYQFGPMEWLWRTLTYGRRQPLHLGETYSDMKPPWPRRMAAKIHPRLALVSAWLLLLIWAGGLALWYDHLENQVSEIDLGPVIARTTETAIAAQAGDGAAEQEGKAVAIATPIVRPVAYNPGPAAASGDLLALASALNADSVLAQIEALTGRPYQGRYAGSAEGWAAGNYIANEFARYGLQPAGDGGSFFQDFPLEYVTLDALPSLVVEGPNGTIYDDYLLHRDFSAIIGGYLASGTAGGQVLWANNCTHADLDSLAVMGKIVLCRDGPIMQAGRNALEHGAVGLLLLADPDEQPPDLGHVYKESWVPEPIPAFRIYPSVVDELLLGSGKSVNDLSIHFDSFPLATRARINVTTTGPEACPVGGCRGRNVLGVIPGRDPAYADQVIIIGAHYDHLGHTPDGIIWAGANDNASGVALLLEIARSWQEQGYVPRHTVLFAAWDAAEMNLAGSGHYVARPRYPLENTLANIQLDMIGAGGDILYIDGQKELAARLRSLAENLGFEAEISDTGGSDHTSFRQVRVPAISLSWFNKENGSPNWRRPSDTLESIDPGKLQAAGKIAQMAILGLTEGGPAIDELLARRAAAIQDGDLAAFLSTSLQEQEAVDRFWYTDLQTWSPSCFEMQAFDLQIMEHSATANVKMIFEYLDEGQTKGKSAYLDTRFVHSEGGWRWAGPDLIKAQQESGFALYYPPGKEKGLAGLGELAADQYAEIASALGLPVEPEAALMLFSSSKSLWTSTGLALPQRGDVWIGPGTIKMVYSQNASVSTKLTDSLVRLVLANAGVTESAAPWLWQGLPLAWRARDDDNLAATHEKYMSQVQGALLAENPAQNEATFWAAVDYLRQQIGWQGLGEFVLALGQACRQGRCESADGVNAALAQVTQIDSAAFETAWQSHWRDRLAAAQAKLDVVLAARTAAVLDVDEAAFLGTVDSNQPGLLAEERYWLASLAEHPLENFSLSGKPLAFMQDGALLASVTLRYRHAENNANIILRVLFTAHGDGYRWAGVPFKTMQSDRVSLLYPEGQEAVAQDLLDKAEFLYPQVAAAVGASDSEALIVKLYESAEAFGASISPAFPHTAWLAAWTGDGAAVKLQLRKDAEPSDYYSALAIHLARRLLYRMGVDSEWLVKGASLYLTGAFNGGASERAAAENLSALLREVTKGRSGPLAGIPADYELLEKDLALTNTQAWDAVRYLVYTHGRQALLDLLRNQRYEPDLDAALQNAIGQTLPEFEIAWAESLAQAHIAPEWVEIANDFDPEMARDHVEALAAMEMAGRQAGSPGAQAAAIYIAGKFAQYGLTPVAEGMDTTFLQPLPISYTTMLALPRLEVVDNAGQGVESFTFREHFLTLLGTAGDQGARVDELVWIRDETYSGMELDGKIALRRLSAGADIAQEIERAIEHGAGGLILIGDVENRKELLSKRPLPVNSISDQAIPVLELTRKGYSRLLEVTGQTPPALQNSPPAMPLGVRFRVEFPLSVPQTVETANVLGLLPGSDPVSGQQVIIMGAHYDHVGDDPDGRRYPGANDDASGVGVLLEIAHLWQERGYRPSHSVLFAAWGAQEMGMLGSRYYVKHPVLPLEKTITMLQMDAVGGGSGHYMEAQGLREREGQWLFNMEVVEDLVDGRLKLTVPVETNDFSEPTDPLYISMFEMLASQWLAAKESDHMTFHQVGIPALLVSWRGANESNWPEELAYEVEPYRLGVTGRMVTLATMAIAR